MLKTIWMGGASKPRHVFWQSIGGIVDLSEDGTAGDEAKRCVSCLMHEPRAYMLVGVVGVWRIQSSIPLHRLSVRRLHCCTAVSWGRLQVCDPSARDATRRAPARGTGPSDVEVWADQRQRRVDFGFLVISTFPEDCCPHASHDCRCHPQSSTCVITISTAVVRKCQAAPLWG